MIYSPAEDSYLIEKEVCKRARGKKVLDVGTGSGILARAALRVGAHEVLAVDISDEVIEVLKKEKFEVCKSDLFEKVSGKFDLIIFNPPYLPEDSREDLESARTTTGGEKGDEIVMRFLRGAEAHMEKGGRILLLVSSLTPRKRIEKILREEKLKKEVAASEKIFMERLEVWEIRKLER